MQTRLTLFFFIPLIRIVDIIPSHKNKKHRIKCRIRKDKQVQRSITIDERGRALRHTKHASIKVSSHPSRPCGTLRRLPAPSTFYSPCKISRGTTRHEFDRCRVRASRRLTFLWQYMHSGGFLYSAWPGVVLLCREKLLCPLYVAWCSSQ